MTNKKIEYFRDITSIKSCETKHFLNYFKIDEKYKQDDLPCRGYNIYKNGEPMVYIEEFFLPDLNKYLK